MGQWKHGLLGVLGSALLMLAGASLCSQPANAESPSQYPSIPGVHERMAQLVSQAEIAGAVTLVATPDKIIHLDCVGMADLEHQQPMQMDTIFWIASMTKPITGVAICKLEEEGKLRLSDPVEKYLPEFKELKNRDGQHVSVTIEQLMTHTSGLEDFKGPELIKLKTLAELMPLIVSKPVKFAPGSKWQYCQTGINTAGRIVEVLSGMSFDRYLQKEFFDPLGMVDTTFYLTEAQLPRLATAYQRTEDGKLEPPKTHWLLQGQPATSRDRFPAANGGLFSTAPDYARFCQMVLNEGEWQGRRYLSAESVRRFREIHTAKNIVTGFTPGNGWGVGTCVIRDPQGITALYSPGTFGHGGAYGTQVWIDPVKKLALILMTQRSNFPPPSGSDGSIARAVFQEAVLARE